MDSSILSISEILTKAQSFVSVGFSSGYSFDEGKAAEYFDNLLLNSESSPIFSGILVMEKSGDEFTIIDGAQRVTTLNLLLFALCQTYKATSKKNDEAGNKILNRFLRNNNQPKLKLVGEDNSVFEKIILAKDLDEKDKHHNLYITYKTFLSKIKENKITANKLYKIISSVQFMLILTDKTKISARELYQVVNNKNDSQLNLISDFIKQENEEAFKTWAEISTLLNNSTKLLQSFTGDFLITRIEEAISNKNGLYNNFKIYFHKISKYQDAKTILKNMLKYAQYYVKIISADFESDAVREQMKLLNEHNGKDTYPYLMEVLDDLENSHIEEGAFINILMMINLFIKSREESSISNVNIDFSTLSKELNKMLVFNDYVPDLLQEDKLTINEINNLSNFEV